MDELLLKLFEIEAVKFGSFVLKSGITSPIYFDLRVIISFPEIMRRVSELMWTSLESAGVQYDLVCGVPYTALPIATLISADHNVPMLIRRKEAKDYGTKKMIEGRYSAGDKCMIIEDVVTTGSSVRETVKSLTDVGLVVTDAIVLLDREQGGAQRLKQEGITLHSVCTVSRLLSVLQAAGKVSTETAADVKRFIADNNTFQPSSDIPQVPSKKKVLPYSERAALSSRPLTRRMLTIMAEKETNLAVSADVTSSGQLLKLADQVGPHICMLKTHVDILEDFSSDFTAKLRELSQKHNFVIFEDRKFADIGNTVKHQLSGGVYRISQWADLINAHALPGPGIIHGLKQALTEPDTQTTCQGCLLIAQMSSEGNLADDNYAKQVVSMATSNPDFVVGFISQSRLTDDPTLLHMTPGVKLVSGGDGLGQQYLTPAEVITKRGSDLIIVGRGVTEAADPAEAARSYQEAGFKAYRDTLEA